MLMRFAMLALVINVGGVLAATSGECRTGGARRPSEFGRGRADGRRVGQGEGRRQNDKHHRGQRSRGTLQLSGKTSSFPASSALISERLVTSLQGRCPSRWQLARQAAET